MIYLGALVGVLILAAIIIALIPMRPATRLTCRYVIDALAGLTGLLGLLVGGSGFVAVIIIGGADAAWETWRYRKDVRANGASTSPGAQARQANATHATSASHAGDRAQNAQLCKLARGNLSSAKEHPERALGVRQAGCLSLAALGGVRLGSALIVLVAFLRKMAERSGAC